MEEFLKREIPALANKKEDLNKAMNNLDEILNLNGCQQGKEEFFNRCINVYDIINDGSRIEPVIIEALSRKIENALDTLKLAVKWNQIEKIKEMLRRTKVNKKESII